MKKSASITLTAVAAMGIAACNRSRPDPCEAATFNEQACNDAVRNHGYHYGGSWVPMYYSHPYPYYYDSYRGYVSRGGSVRSVPSGSYAAPAAGASSGTSVSSPSGVTRGGFGSTGASHGSSGGGSGSGS
jgi:hypothetical protein